MGLSVLVVQTRTDSDTGEEVPVEPRPALAAALVGLAVVAAALVIAAVGYSVRRRGTPFMDALKLNPDLLQIYEASARERGALFQAALAEGAVLAVLAGFLLVRT